MNQHEKLDTFITEMLARDFTEGQIAELLLFEDDVLTETVRRVRRKVSGINVTMRKTGRPNPLRSQRAKRAARAHRASRLQAMRRFQRSPKAKQMRRVMSRVRKTKPRRPTVKKHGPPRRGYKPVRRR